MIYSRVWDMHSALDEYALWTNTTAVYRKTAEPAYLALGLNEEIAELEAASNALSISLQSGYKSNSNLRLEEVKEAGDSLWYTVRYITNVLEKQPSFLLNAASGSSLRPHLADARRAAALIAGIEKKKLRGDAPSVKAVAMAEFSATTILMYFVHRGDLEYVIQENKKKLESRKERDVLHGSGDNR